RSLRTEPNPDRQRPRFAHAARGPWGFQTGRQPGTRGTDPTGEVASDPFRNGRAEQPEHSGPTGAPCGTSGIDSGPCPALPVKPPIQTASPHGVSAAAPMSSRMRWTYRSARSQADQDVHDDEREHHEVAEHLDHRVVHPY